MEADGVDPAEHVVDVGPGAMRPPVQHNWEMEVADAIGVDGRPGPLKIVEVAIGHL